MNTRTNGATATRSQTHPKRRRKTRAGRQGRHLWPYIDVGDLIITPAAQDALRRANVTPLGYGARHARCDWGEASDADRWMNWGALRAGDPVHSMYTLPNGEHLWIITTGRKGHRSTKMLVPEDFGR